MTGWQRPARLAVGAFGIACALVVYVGLGERARPAPPPVLERIDPNAVIESVGGVLQGIDEGFEVRFDTSAAYQDGSSRLTGVRITAPNRDGRSFVVTAREAVVPSAARNSLQLELRHDVHLRASDGFELTTGSGSFTEHDATVRASGPVTFGKDRMSGSGRGMTYDLNTDVLRVAAQARVRIAGDAGARPTTTTAGSAILDRGEDTLQLDRDVRVDGAEAMRADRALARLSPGAGHIMFVELRGHAEVAGGAAIDAMRARDIDLDYTDDGRALERATLTGDATVAVLDGTVAREFSGQSLDVVFAGDGSLGRVAGHTRVEMVLPASADAPARRVASSSFQAAGRGGSLTNMRFDGDVVYREETIGGTPRVARATALSLEVAADGSLARAVFTGGTTFEDGTLGARAAEARYEPGRGALALSGTDALGEPSVEDEDVVIDARAIAIALEARRIEADGSVKTSLLPGSRRSTGAPVREANREPSGAAGLLAPGEVARVTADALVYDGAAGTARYSGRVRLWQTQTDLRADMIDIHLATGDLTARGSARAALALDGDRSEGEAHEIVYVDAERRVTYAAAPDAAGGPPAAPARLTGPLGDLRAGRISVFLAEADGRVARLEGEGGVDALLDGRRVTGAHLTYRASDERYVVTGSPTAPVRVRVTEPCREMLGGTLIYSRAADTMHVDGSEVSRTQTTRGGSCR